MPVRPRDASTLIVVRPGNRDPLCLMGRRHANSEFLPGYFVFPGGAVEEADRRARAASPLDLTHLGSMGVGGNATTAAALGVAAVRETYEETGIMIAAPGDVGNAPGGTFDEMRSRGVAPALGAARLPRSGDYPGVLAHPIPRTVLPHPAQARPRRTRRRRRAARSLMGASLGRGLPPDHRDHPLHGRLRKRDHQARSHSSLRPAGLHLSGEDANWFAISERAAPPRGGSARRRTPAPMPGRHTSRPPVRRGE